MSKIRIGTRLGIAFALVLLITLGIAGASIQQIQRLKEASAEMVEHDMQRNELTQLWAANVRLNLLQVEASLKSSDPAYTRALQEAALEVTRVTTPIRERLDQLLADDTGRALLQRVAEVRKQFVDKRGALFQRKEAGEDVSSAVDAELRPLAVAYGAALDAVSKHSHDSLEATVASVADDALTSQYAMAAGAALALLLGAALATFVTRSITRPIGVAVETAEAIGAGDLSRRIEWSGEDETARLLHALELMQQKLAEIVQEVRQGAESVATASQQIAQGNNDLSGRTEQQASALQQTASAMEELAATVRQNADNAQQANQLAAAASAVATEGGEMVGRVVSTMDGISESSRRIADIIGVIDGIAFQTNILALNAAVEAARAGEQGRGFAVVAGEVRNLAQRSAEAAKEIKSLITASVERVEQGSALVDRAGATMEEVVVSIRRVTDIMGEISSASAEQSQGVVQVGEAVGQMDQVTQQNAALVEESAAAAASLNQQAQQLVDAVAVFKLAAGTAAPPAPPARAATARAPVAAPPRAPKQPPPADAQRPAKKPAPAAAGASGEDWEQF